MTSIAIGTALLSILLAATSANGQPHTASQRQSPLLPYTQCAFTGGLAPFAVDRAKTLPMARPVETAAGTKRVSVADGYRVMLAFPNTGPFVNLKIEMSVVGQYVSDKQIVMEQMEQMETLAAAKGVTMRVERSTVDGIDVAALNNPSLQPAGISFFSLFDDKREVIASAYFLNQKPERRAFQDMDTYSQLRDAFIRDLASCMARNRSAPAEH